MIGACTRKSGTPNFHRFPDPIKLTALDVYSGEQITTGSCVLLKRIADRRTIGGELSRNIWRSGKFTDDRDIVKHIKAKLKEKTDVS